MSLKNVNIVELRLVGRTDRVPQNAEDLPPLIMSNPLSVSGADRCSVFPRWAVLAFCVATALLQAIHATSTHESYIKITSKSVNIHGAKHKEEHDGQPAEK